MQPLKPAGTFDEIFDIDCVSDGEARQKNIIAAVARGLPQVEWHETRKGKLAIVASGPSVTHDVPILKEWDGEIWGINGAFAWLIHRGIKPHGFVGIDPEWFLKDYLINPPKDATYYLAAQVHPDVFDHLKEHDVRIWFQSDGEVKFPFGVRTIPGGSTCLGRAPYLATFLGWEDVHIFGGDSSFTHKTHVYGGELPERKHMAEVRVGKRTFMTLRNLLVQANEMVQIVQNFPGKITVHGDGLMPALCQQMKDSGVDRKIKRLEAKEAAILSGLNRQQRRALRAG